MAEGAGRPPGDLRRPPAVGRPRDLDAAVRGPGGGDVRVPAARLRPDVDPAVDHDGRRDGVARQPVDRPQPRAGLRVVPVDGPVGTAHDLPHAAQFRHDRGGEAHPRRAVGGPPRVAGPLVDRQQGGRAAVVQLQVDRVVVLGGAGAEVVAVLERAVLRPQVPPPAFAAVGGQGDQVAGREEGDHAAGVRGRGGRGPAVHEIVGAGAGGGEPLRPEHAPGRRVDGTDQQRLLVRPVHGGDVGPPAGHDRGGLPHAGQVDRPRHAVVRGPGQRQVGGVGHAGPAAAEVGPGVVPGPGIPGDRRRQEQCESRGGRGRGGAEGGHR